MESDNPYNKRHIFVVDFRSVFHYESADYMIPTCPDEISTHPAEADFTLRLHVEIKFRPGKAGQFSTWYLIRFTCIFFGFFFVSMSFYKTEDS